MQFFYPPHRQRHHLMRNLVHFFILLTLICSTVFVFNGQSAPVQAQSTWKPGKKVTKVTKAVVNSGHLTSQQASIDSAGTTATPATKPIHKYSNPNRQTNPKSPNVASVGAGSQPGTSSSGSAQSGGFQGSSLTPGINFTGAAGHFDSTHTPPDTMGDVGSTQYTIALNDRIRTFNKHTGQPDGAIDVNTDTFFFAVSQDGGTSDPHIRFDRFSNRWFITMINVASASNLLMIAVSDSDIITPATNWLLYAFPFDIVAPVGDPQAGCFFDYPVLGVDANALYIGGNIFCGPGNSFFQGTAAVVVQKSSALSGNANITILYDLSTLNSGGIYTPHGVDNDDPSPTYGYFMGVDLFFSGQLDLIQVQNADTASPLFSSLLTIITPTTNGPTVNAPTQGAAFPLDDSDSRIMEVRVRDHTMWASHVISVNQNGTSSSSDSPADDRTGVRWYQITFLDTPTPSLIQAGTIFDPTNTATPLWYTYGSLVPNGQGHVAFGMTQTGQTAYANAAYTGRLFTDQMGYTDAPPIPYTTANVPYTSFEAPALENFYRWGDFSMTSVDPCDDMTFYTIQQFTHDNLSGNPVHWGVQVQQLLVPPPPSVLKFNTPLLKKGALPVNLVVTGAPKYGAGFFNGASAAACATHISASADGGLVVNSVQYTSPTQVILNLSTTNATVGSHQITIVNPDGQSTTGTINVTASNPPTLIVTNLTDDPTAGSGSLRDVIHRSLDGGIVNFQPGLTGTINLDPANGELFIAQNLTINGPGARVITVNGGGHNRVFDIGGSFTYTISGLTLTGGNADAAAFPAGGGAIEVTGSVANLYDLNITGNTGGSAPGGGINNLGGIVYIARSTISNNTSSNAGGGILNRVDGDGVMTIVNSTISGNTASGTAVGGGIQNRGPLTLINVTVANNTAAQGGNIFNNSNFNTSRPGGTLYLQNSILTGGTATAGLNNGPDISGQLDTLGYNIILTPDQSTAFLNLEPTDLLGQNPLLGALQNNGGPTDTMLPANNSPAINRIPVANLPPSLDGSGPKDQRGFIRPAIPGGNGTIGAVEVGARLVPADLLGIYNAGNWWLRAADGSNFANVSYGASGWIPVTGDWNGDGITKFGIYHDGAWYLLGDDNMTLYTSFSYGGPGWLPVVGDWTGTGHVGIGIYQNGSWYLRNTLGFGAADISFFYGGAGWLPVVGDWTGTGHAGMGIYQNGSWYLRNNLSFGAADFSFLYGAAGWTPVTGHWTGLPNSGIGIYQNGAWYLRNTPSSGASADETAFYGASGWRPVVGDWAGPSIASIPKTTQPVVTPSTPTATSIPPTFQPPTKKKAK